MLYYAFKLQPICGNILYSINKCLYLYIFFYQFSAFHYGLYDNISKLLVPYSFYHNFANYCVNYTQFIDAVWQIPMLASSAVDGRFQLWSGQIKDYQIGICCFSAKHAALRGKSKDWLARNKENVSAWSELAIRELLFQWANTIKIQIGVLV